MKPETPSGEIVRTLNENEIQERLYGSYHARSNNDSVWTGSPILAGEVQRLRSELISLRKEKEALATHLQKIQQSGLAESRVLETASGAGWFGRLLGVLLMAGALGYWISAGMLQASPAAGDPTPYTLQVGVYDGPVMAQRAEGLLRELGYDAFVVESPRLDGRSRYRIYVGSFVTKAEARLENDRLAADSRFQDFKDAFVRVR